jgi:hypothetical protein
LEKERKKYKIQINFNFSDLNQYMANGGLVLQKTKFPECNTPIPLPEIGSQSYVNIVEVLYWLKMFLKRLSV